MTRMFTVNNQTMKVVNPIVGCLHNCLYCWARDLALGKLKDTPRYRDGFHPQLIEHELKRRFYQGFIFVSDMGDMWGSWVPDEWIKRVLEVTKKSPGATFLLLTKNPVRYHSFLDYIGPNVILGATIETNRTSHVSTAPQPIDRAEAMATLPSKYRRMVSIEPIMDFDLDLFVGMIRDIDPELVYVGYDNHTKNLPEPPLAKTRALMTRLEGVTAVRAKTLRQTWWEVV